MEIKKMTKQEGHKIIDDYDDEKAPKGLFYFEDGDWFIGIDNSTGDCWVEEFITEDLCIKWLNREISMEDL